jgi:hypothetical protein
MTADTLQVLSRLTPRQGSLLLENGLESDYGYLAADGDKENMAWLAFHQLVTTDATSFYVRRWRITERGRECKAALRKVLKPE